MRLTTCVALMLGWLFISHPLYAADIVFEPITALDGAISFSADSTSTHVQVNDLLNNRPLKTIPCEEPSAASLLPDESALVVFCQKQKQLIWINSGFYDVTKTQPVASLAQAQLHLDALSKPPKSHREIIKEVVLLGTVHDEHYTNKNYSIDRLRKTIEAVHATVALIEIPANHFERGLKEFLESGKVTATRFAVYPEYTDILLPMARNGTITLIPTAGWSEPMNHFRNQALDAIRHNPMKKKNWALYQNDQEQLAREEKKHGGDATFINSAEYDKSVAKAQQHYAEFDLGPGSWERINASHIRGIERALDAIDTPNTRVLITYGALHKYKIMKALLSRPDVKILDSRQFIPSY